MKLSVHSAFATTVVVATLLSAAPGWAQVKPKPPGGGVIIRREDAFSDLTSNRASLRKIVLIPALPDALAAYEEPYKGKLDKTLTLLAMYLKNTGVAKEIEDADVTVFALHNLAFAHAPTEVFQPGERERFKTLLRDHIVKGRHTYDTLLEAVRRQNGPVALATLSGAQLFVRSSEGGLMLEGGTKINRNDPFDGDKVTAWPKFRRSYLRLRPGRTVNARKGAGIVIDDFIRPQRPVGI